MILTHGCHCALPCASLGEWADDFVINYGLLPRALGIRTQIHYVTRVPQKSKRKGKGKDKKKNKGKDKDKGSMLGSIAM